MFIITLKCYNQEFCFSKNELGDLVERKENCYLVL